MYSSHIAWDGIWDEDRVLICSWVVSEVIPNSHSNACFLMPLLANYQLDLSGNRSWDVVRSLRDLLVDTPFLKGEKAGSHKAELRLPCKFDKASANPTKHQSNDFPLEKPKIKQKSPDPCFPTNSVIAQSMASAHAEMEPGGVSSGRLSANYIPCSPISCFLKGEPTHGWHKAGPGFSHRGLGATF